MVLKWLTETIIVEDVENEHIGERKLEKWSDTNTSCLNIFMLPTPVCTAESPYYSLWSLVTTSKPCTNFADFQLSEWSIGYGIEAKQIIWLIFAIFTFAKKIWKKWRLTHRHWLCNFSVKRIPRFYSNIVTIFSSFFFNWYLRFP